MFVGAVKLTVVDALPFVTLFMVGADGVLYVVADIELDAFDVPTALIAFIVILYVIFIVKPVIVYGEVI